MRFACSGTGDDEKMPPLMNNRLPLGRIDISRMLRYHSPLGEKRNSMLVFRL